MISKRKLKKKIAKNREEIVMTVPSFINQLLLLLNSGVVLSDAFCQIAKNYGSLQEKRKNYFTEEVHKIYEKSQKTGENVITQFFYFSKKANVKELSRVAGIMVEGQKKGSDLWDKLAEQGEYLWAERKRAALRKIRLAESKMSFPLGFFLGALLIMTAAPALMQI